MIFKGDNISFKIQLILHKTQISDIISLSDEVENFMEVKVRNIKVKSLVSVFQVSDINKSVEWYRKWLGEPDSMPMEGVVEYEITPGTWLQLSQTENVVNSSIILGIDDIKECRSTLENIGIKTGEIADYEVVHVFDVFDIDNNQISFVQEL